MAIKLFLDLAKLTDESKEFARWLFAWKPEWQALAKMEIIEHISKDKYSLFVEIASPTGKADRNLILAMADEPSIFFHNWHSHLDLMGPTEADSLEEFKRMVAGILSDNLVSCFDPKMQFSSLIEPGDRSEILDYLTAPESSGEVEIISFNGTADGRFNSTDIGRH